MSRILIYVASSWRNERQPEVVRLLRSLEHFDVYDFREPAAGDSGFHWSEIDPNWQQWTADQFRRHSQSSPLLKRWFAADMSALDYARIVVLVLPCGRSAHLEFGWAVRNGAIGIILLDNGEPELMYRMATDLCVGLDDLVGAVTLARNRITARLEDAPVNGGAQ